jgi:hypothetical protein
MRVAINLGALLLAFCSVAAPVTAADVITGCDLLAAHPADPDKLGAGVSSSIVKQDLPTAIAVCRRDLRNDPENARLRYNLGRVLYYSGQFKEGFAEVSASAEQRHRQALFVAGLIYGDGQAELFEPQPCKALPLWLDAARQNHYAARISLARNYLRGEYADCGVDLDRAEMRGFVESAAGETKSYYESLLVSYLLEQLDTG